MIIDIVEERKLGGGLSCKRFCIFKSSNHIRISKVTYDVNHFFFVSLQFALCSIASV